MATDDDAMYQAIHDASVCLGAECLGPGVDEDQEDYGDEKSYDSLIKRLRNALRLA
jgi:hypothetical protein